MHSISVKDEGWYASRFQVCSRLDGNKMSGGYPPWGVRSSMGISRSSRAARPSRASWCSSKGNVECISDMLRVLMLVASTGGGIVAPSRYNGSSDVLHCCCHGLCRHSVAIAWVVNWERSARCPWLDTPTTVWASWATWFDSRRCASDLYVDGGDRFFLSIWVHRGRIDFDSLPFVVGLSCSDAMVEFVPLVVAPHYWCQRVCYLPAEVMIPPIVSRVTCFDM